MNGPENGFKVITVGSWVKVEVLEPDGLPALDLSEDEPYLMVSQPTEDPDQPEDVDLIHLTLAEAREFSSGLAELLSRFPG